MQETTCCLNTNLSETETQLLAYYALRAKVARLEKELSQSRAETARYSGFVTELRADLRERVGVLGRAQDYFGKGTPEQQLTSAQLLEALSCQQMLERCWENAMVSPHDTSTALASAGLLHIALAEEDGCTSPSVEERNSTAMSLAPSTVSNDQKPSHSITVLSIRKADGSQHSWPVGDWPSSKILSLLSGHLTTSTR